LAHVAILVALIPLAPASELARAAEGGTPAAPLQKPLDLSTVEPRVRDMVRIFTKLFYDGKLDELFTHFSPGLREVMPREALGKLHQHVLETYGHETSLLGEEAAERGEYRAFVRWARFDKHEGIMEVQWRLRSDDTIAGFLIRPAQKPPQKADEATHR